MGQNSRTYRIKKQSADTKVLACGFKAGQSPRGRIGFRVECAQTIAAGMSAIEPTVVFSRTSPLKNLSEK